MLKFIFSFFIAASFLTVQAQGIEFFDGEWTDALEKATETDQLMFVDAYAKWCGPCKRMDKQVFPDASVGSFFNTNFISIKVDMESESGRAFNKKYPVSSYPTFLFIRSDGELIHRVRGYRTPEKLLEVARLAIRKDDRSADMQADYDSGNRDYKFMLKYVKALNRAGKSSLKVSNDYVNSNPEITKKQKAEFLYEATSEADSRLFKLMIKHKKVLESIKTERQIKGKIEKACDATVEKAIDFQSEDLLKEAQNKMSKHVADKAKAFTIESNMRYYESIGDIDLFLKEAKKYINQVAVEDDKLLISVSNYLSQQYRHNADAQNLASYAAEKAIKARESVDTYLNFAKILKAQGNKAKAKVNAEKALSIAKKNGENTFSLERYVKSLESD